MKIGYIAHKRLRRFIEDNDAAGLPPQNLAKLRVIVSFLAALRDEAELKKVPLWRIHQLKGDEKGKWSLSITRNWRLTFRIDAERGEIFDLDYEDYH